MRKMIGGRHEVNSLYYLDGDPRSGGAAALSSGLSSSVALSLDYSILQPVSSLECEVCQLGNHQHVYFPSRIENR